MVTRLTGGLTPADGGDPRTFPAIHDEVVDELERLDGAKAGTGHTAQGLTSGATTLDFAGTAYESHTVDGDVTYSTANLAAGRAKAVFVTASGAARTLTVPAGWVFAGPTQPDAGTLTVPDGQTAILSLYARGGADADVVAAFAVEG